MQWRQLAGFAWPWPWGKRQACLPLRHHCYGERESSVHGGSREHLLTTCMKEALFKVSLAMVVLVQDKGPGTSQHFAWGKVRVMVKVFVFTLGYGARVQV